jgi:hypothetical protein
MTTTRLVGSGTVGTTSLLKNYFRLSKFTAEFTGKVTEFKVYGTANGNAKIGVYADSSGAPGVLLAANNTGQAVTANQWNTLEIDDFYVTQGVDYWLAINFDTDSVMQTGATGTGTDRYKTATYSSFSFPDPAGSGFTSGTRAYNIAGWGVLVLSPSSISQPIAYGTPQLLYPLFISPSSITQLISIGTPTVSVPLLILPQSIVQQILIGSPKIMRYVWHVILDGQYATETPGINRTYIIGRDQYGNPVYGTAVDSTELGLVGERLDFQQELAIPLTAQAAEVAAAILSKMRITTKKGLIFIPPNCGQELFDVVQITDSGANQAAVSFRVVGIRFEYDPKQAKYEHKLILGAS